MPGYGLMASPTLYPGQVVRAVVEVPPEAAPVVARLLIMAADEGDRCDELQRVTGPATCLWRRARTPSCRGPYPTSTGSR